MALRRVLAWSIGLWRLAAGRSRADWRFLVGVWLLLACATTLLAAGVLYGDAVAVGSVRAAMKAAPAANQGVSVRSAVSPAQVSAADAPVRRAIGASLGASGRP